LQSDELDSASCGTTLTLIREFRSGERRAIQKQA
jgi:hypothetical protein